MATINSFSVVANTYVKQPVRSPSVPISTYAKDCEEFHLENQTEVEKTDESTKSQEEEVTFQENIHQSLSDLTDDAFYQKLTQLKNEHKKTLNLCEKLYKQKQIQSGQEDNMGSLDTSVDFSAYTSTARNVLAQQNVQQSKDNICDLSAKPPSGRTKSSSTPLRNSQNFDTSITQSFDDNVQKQSREAWINTSDVFDDTKENDISRLSALSKIDDMWDTFSIERYAPRLNQRSASLSGLPTKSKAQREAQLKSDQWRHRITIPEPFNMTLRETRKEKTKSKTQKIFEEERQRKIKQEEEECQKKFKAKPVPAHVHIPKYHDIIEAQESRRRYIRQHCADLVKSIEQPFNFAESKHTHESRPKSLESYDREEPRTFKARPFPEHIFDNCHNEKMKEEEEYRKIRIQMRSKEMLRSASLPPNMKSRGPEYVNSHHRSKERAASAKPSKNRQFNPKINGKVPEFDEIHRAMQREMGHRKNDHMATVCKPFKLHHTNTMLRDKKIYEDMKNDEDTLNESRWPYANPRAKPKHRYSLSGSFSNSMDSLPTRLTASTEMRTSANKQKLQELLKNEESELILRKQRLQKERSLQEQVSKRAAANKTTEDLDIYTKKKLKDFRKADHEQRQAYRERLNEMQSRVESRPLLFERTSETNAKMAAERRYRDALQRAGVQEEFVDKKSSMAHEQDIELDDSDDKYYEKYNEDTYDEKTANDKDEDSYTLDEYSRAASNKSSPMHTAGTISQYSSGYEEDVTATRSHTPSRSHTPAALRSHTPSEGAPVYIEGSDIDEDITLED